MAVEAVRNAMADCIGPEEVDDMMSYQINDSTPSTEVAGDLGKSLESLPGCGGALGQHLPRISLDK